MPASGVVEAFVPSPKVQNAFLGSGPDRTEVLIKFTRLFAPIDTWNRTESWALELMDKKADKNRPSR